MLSVLDAERSPRVRSLLVGVQSRGRAPEASDPAVTESPEVRFTRLLRDWQHSGTVPHISKEALVAFCPSCGTQIADGTSCPKCASAAPGTVAATPSGAGLADNVAGALAYVTIIPAIIFLVLEPFNKRRFVRFHAFQCLFFAVAWTVLWILLSIVAHIPLLGWLTVLVWPLVSLLGFIVWLVLVLKAYQGQEFKLPVIGDMAAQQAGA